MSTATQHHTADRVEGPMFRACRKATGLSTRGLATLSEVSHSTISRWERGRSDIGPANREHLTLALADFIAGGAR